MPPFRLLAAYLWCGFAWLALGAAGLVLVAPGLAQAHVLDPRTIAVTHAFTLGWMTTMLFGLLLQVFPGALGIGARSQRAAWLTLVLLEAGVVTMVVAAWRWSAPGLAVGAVILFWAVFVMGWNLLPQRRKAPRGRTIGRYVAAGHAGLGLAVFVGMARVADALGWWTVPRLGVLAAHVHLAVVGYATVTVAGVGSRMLPLFLGSRGYPEWPLAWIRPLLALGLAGYATGAVAGWRWLAVPGALATAAGTALFVYQWWEYYRRRTLRRLDPALALVAGALACLVLALPVGLVLLLRDFLDLQLVAAYGILGVAGWLALVVCGTSLRIVPALSWTGRFGARATLAAAPTVADLSLPPLGWAAALLLPAGAIGTAAAVWRGHAGAAQVGAAMYAAGAAAYLAHQARALLVRGDAARPAGRPSRPLPIARPSSGLYG